MASAAFGAAFAAHLAVDQEIDLVVHLGVQDLGASNAFLVLGQPFGVLAQHTAHPRFEMRLNKHRIFEVLETGIVALLQAAQGSIHPGIASLWKMCAVGLRHILMLALRGGPADEREAWKDIH